MTFARAGALPDVRARSGPLGRCVTDESPELDIATVADTVPAMTAAFATAGLPFIRDNHTPEGGRAR